VSPNFRSLPARECAFTFSGFRSRHDLVAAREGAVLAEVTLEPEVASTSLTLKNETAALAGGRSLLSESCGGAQRGESAPLCSWVLGECPVVCRTATGARGRVTPPTVTTSAGATA
jgi:hypothetical protein